jgi:D-glycero-D-manno-heptose 1,7-bisphosphate phosphatase
MKKKDPRDQKQTAIVKSITTVFLDRDGVINEDSDAYIKSRDEFHPLPGSLAAIARLSQSGIRVIVITNQSAINRGMVPLTELEAIHGILCAAVDSLGGRITDIFFCPHRPDEACGCRKPKPGLIQAAGRRYGVDLSRSVMIGDSAKDILAGKAAGCALTVLVRTGKAQEAIRLLAAAAAQPDHIAADLDAAVQWLIDPERA